VFFFFQHLALIWSSNRSSNYIAWYLELVTTECSTLCTSVKYFLRHKGIRHVIDTTRLNTRFVEGYSRLGYTTDKGRPNSPLPDYNIWQLHNAMLNLLPEEILLVIIDKVADIPVHTVTFWLPTPLDFTQTRSQQPQPRLSEVLRPRTSGVVQIHHYKCTRWVEFVLNRHPEIFALPSTPLSHTSQRPSFLGTSSRKGQVQMHPLYSKKRPLRDRRME